MVCLGAFTIAYSSVVNSSFNVNKYFVLDFLAFTALPGSLSSHDFLIAFSLSSFVVSLINATVSDAKIVVNQYKLSVSSDFILASGHSLKSNDAYIT